jgi:hypothetical protein
MIKVSYIKPPLIPSLDGLILGGLFSIYLKARACQSPPPCYGGLTPFPASGRALKGLVVIRFFRHCWQSLT